MRLILAFVFLLSIPVFAQEQQSLTFDQVKEIQMEVMRQKWIRIVEPVIHSLQVFGMKSYVGIENDVFKNCGKTINTESGQAWVTCDAKPESIIWYHGGPIEDMWGDRVIDVTVEGYDTHEHLCYIDYKNKSLGLGACNKQKERYRIEPVVLAHHSIITRIHRYTKDDEFEREKFIKQTGGVLDTSAGPMRIRPIKAGDPKIWEVVASKATYEFPKLSQ